MINAWWLAIAFIFGLFAFPAALTIAFVLCGDDDYAFAADNPWDQQTDDFTPCHGSRTIR